MIGLSKSTGYAILTLSCLAASGGRRVFAKEIARCTGVPGAYLSKILRLLSQAGLIEAKRGYRGGVSLVLDPKHITLLTVADAIEGPDARIRRTKEFWKNELLRLKLNLIFKFKRWSTASDGFESDDLLTTARLDDLPSIRFRSIE